MLLIAFYRYYQKRSPLEKCHPFLLMLVLYNEVIAARGGGEGYVHQALSGIAPFAVKDIKIVNITLKFTSIFNFRQNEPMTCLLVKIPTYYWLDKDTYVWFIMAAKYKFGNLMLYHLLMKASFELVALLKQESYVYKDVIRGGFIFYPTPLKIR